MKKRKLHEIQKLSASGHTIRVLSNLTSDERFEVIPQLFTSIEELQLPPVIKNKFGIRVLNGNLREDHLAYTQMGNELTLDEDNLIMINQNLNENSKQKEFALAYELIHLLLYHKGEIFNYQHTLYDCYPIWDHKVIDLMMNIIFDLKGIKKETKNIDLFLEYYQIPKELMNVKEDRKKER